jgi:hypothetical protein
MKHLKKYIPLAVSYFYILLFCYAAISKVTDFENFQVQIGQSPLLSAYAGFISYAVIIAELFIVAMLIFEPTRRTGLYASTALMSAFSVYIFLILNYSDFVPCSCGGILEKMGWTEHLIFNIITVVLGVLALALRIEPDDFQPRKKVIFNLLTLNCLSIITVIFLFLSSEHIIKRENNFTRRFLIHPIIEDQILDLKLDSYYFAGIDDHHLYLGNSTTPLILTIVDRNLRHKYEKKIVLRERHYPFKNLQMQVKDAHMYLYDGSVPVIFRGKIAGNDVKNISDGDAYFTQLIVLDSTRFGLRTQSRATQQYTLAELDLKKSPKIRLKEGILQKQIDGVFDSDGKLILDQYDGNPVYVYNYRNEFMVMDSMLGLQKRLQTIDTMRMAKLKITQLKNGSHKISVPAIQNNKSVAVFKSLLFIESNLMGKNESVRAWTHSAIIDMYRTRRQEYSGSFYIPHRKSKSLSSMIATDNSLYILIGKDLIRYKFTKPLMDLYKKGEAENLHKE